MTAAPGTRQASCMAIIGVLFFIAGFICTNGAQSTFLTLDQLTALPWVFVFTMCCLVWALPIARALKRSELEKSLAPGRFVIAAGSALRMRASLRNPLT